MGTNHTFMQRIFLFSSLQAKPLGAIPAGTIVGPISEDLIVKKLDEYGVEVAIPSICKPGDVTCVVISRETERFVNEIHTHEARENLQESKESIKCEGGVDVVGVVTPLVRGGAQVLHGDQVVELSVLLEVHEKEEEGEDGEGHRSRKGGK